MNRRQFLTTSATAFPAIIRARGAAADRMNVLWILGDDLGVELSCYGYRGVHTPNIDRLAGESARFTQFHTTAPVCSASRSAFNVGLYQTTTGTHNHRSHRQDGYKLPAGARLITDRFRDQGYFTCNVVDIAEGVKGNGKTDFNFTAPKPFDGTHWNQRKPGQPFYAQVNFMAPHKGPAFVEARKQKALIDPAKVELPPYFPDHPVVRDEVANYLDAVQLLDHKVGVLLGRLKEEKLLDNTAIFFFGDNGRCLLRGKQWLYQYGTNVPLLVRWPGVARPGTVRDEPCLSLDMTASSLLAGGIALPAPFHGRPLFGANAKPRDFIVTARDRCDMTVERIRAVRDRRYRYIRNFMPERPRTQFNAYIQESYPTQSVIKELHAGGKLNAVQEQWMAPRKPAEEFYDTHADPFEVRNLVDSPAHKTLVTGMAKRLDDWIVETQDKGGIPEPKEELDQWVRPGEKAAVTRRHFTHLLAGAAVAADSRPNIIFLLTDDQRRDSLGCYGNKEIRSPQIDRLAAEGVLFENAFVTSAICTPTRACYFLSQYERRHGINFNSGTSLAPEVWQTSYPMVLRKAGYFTGYIGKNHVPVGPQGYESGIVEKSFDFWYGAHQHLTFYPKTRHPIFRQAKADTQPEVIAEGALSFLDSHAAFVDGAQAFLKQRPEGKPFCLSICFNLPHRAGTGSMKQLPSDPELYRTAYRDRKGEFALPANYIPKANIREPRIPANVLYAQYRQHSYDYVDTEADLREHQVRCYQTITGIDNVVGALREQLAKQGLNRNTVIVFASDHGIMEGEFGLGGKALNYEPCLRIPMIVMDPRLPQWRKGKRSQELVQSIDVAPTLLDLAGVAMPGSMQGRSLTPLLRGVPTRWREYAFAENLWSTIFGNPRVESVRSAEWKYIRYFATDRSLFANSGNDEYGVTPEQRQAYKSWLTASVRGLKPSYEELFHVSSDPNETTNLAANPMHRVKIHQLQKECDRLVREAL